jgi:pimeloyl-ACP methyl ester carboxylesterase
VGDRGVLGADAALVRGAGYRTLAPSWPGKDRPVQQIRADPSALKGLGISEIVASYEQVVRDTTAADGAPPILIGHSFGGLFTQILLDRGLGAAGVAIDPAPPKGVWPFEPTAFRALFGALTRYMLGSRVVRWSFGSFRYAFVHLLPLDEAKAAYDRHVIRETGRIFFQSAMAMVSPRSPTRVDFRNGTRAPLLIIAGGADRIVPPVINRRNYKAYGRCPAKTDFREFAGRNHWIIAQEGWEEVAEHIAGWLHEISLNSIGEEEPGPQRAARIRRRGRN